MPRDGTLLGALFESLVTFSIRVYAKAAYAATCHLRLHNGSHEVDLIIQRPDQRVCTDSRAKHSGRIMHVVTPLGAAVGDDFYDPLVLETE